MKLQNSDSQLKLDFFDALIRQPRVHSIPGLL
jgi:hypothetical protein